ncbi:MAG: ROK family protein [Acidobacteria bacterium]|nr:ROK family protein [Acidobacteriota bacterium]
MNTLALDIGGTKFSLALFEEGRMARRLSRGTDREGGREWMLGAIGEAVAGWKAEGARWDRCGIGFGGPVLFDRQRVALSTHVGGWSDFDLTAWAESGFGVPAVMDNDANVGALGEGFHGSGRRDDGGPAEPLFYMTLSTGIGGGILVNGRVLRGADSYAGEVGHTVIRPGGPECLCGAHGCFERMCCGLWLERDHGRPAHELLAEPEFVRRYVVDLAAGLKTILMLMNPERLVIGGGMSKAGDALFAPLREELGRQMTNWSRARRDVRPAGLADDSVLWGALVLAEQELTSVS